MKANHHRLARHGYSAQVQEHFFHPRNVGTLPVNNPYVGTGQVGSVESGALLRLQLQFDSSGKITVSRFKAYGCGATIASASWLTEALKGKQVEQALAIRSGDVQHALALPAAKLHCAMLAQDAVSAAVADYQHKQE